MLCAFGIKCLCFEPLIAVLSIKESAVIKQLLIRSGNENTTDKLMYAAAGTLAAVFGVLTIDSAQGWGGRHIHLVALQVGDTLYSADNAAVCAICCVGHSRHQAFKMAI